MERKLTYWFAIPFITAAWALTAVAAFVPGSISGDLLVMLLCCMTAMGVIAVIVLAIGRIRAGDSPYEAFYPLVGLIATLGAGFGPVLAIYAYDNWREEARVSDQPGIKIKTSRDGHFRPTAVIGDRTLQFFIDFTAEQLILTREDAKYLGIDTFALRYDREVMVRHQPLKSAAVILPSLRIASLSLSNVPAMVSKDQMPHSIIGVGMLDRLGRWYIERDGVVVQPRPTGTILWHSDG